MENDTLALTQKSTPGKVAKNILWALSAYPLLWTIGILLGGLFKSHDLVSFIMLTWVVAFYIGTLAWLGLAIYLKTTKRITAKEILVHLLIVTAGITSAYCVYTYDILGSGVRYID